MDSTPTGAGRGLAPPPTPSGVTGINVTPLVDVLLVLVIIFLVLVALSRRTLSREVAGDTASPGASEQIVLEILPEAGYRVNGQPVPEAALRQVLQGALGRRQARLVFIKASPARSDQEVVRAADIARGAGASIVALVGGKFD